MKIRERLARWIYPEYFKTFDSFMSEWQMHCHSLCTIKNDLLDEVEAQKAYIKVLEDR